MAVTLNASTSAGFIQTADSSGVIALQTNGTEAMRINTSSSLLVGATDIPDGTSVYGSAFEATTNSRRLLKLATSTTSSNNLIAFYNPNGNIGSISVSASTTTFSTSSDYRLKENIAPMTSALATVAQLKPVTYTWKIDGANGQGFIAHELQAVVPDAVTGEKDAVDAEGNPHYQGIDTSFLVATLTAAIQEQQAIITDLKARIETLENK